MIALRQLWLLFALICFIISGAHWLYERFDRPETIYDRALEARAAIARDDFPAAHRLVAEVVKESTIRKWSYAPFSDFIQATVPVMDPGFASHLDQWIAADASFAPAYLIRAEYDYANGYAERGTGYWKDVPPEHAALFTQYMQKGLQDVLTARQLGNPVPYLYTLGLRFLQHLDRPADSETLFQEGIKQFPDYYTLYSQRLAQLQPKWGGSVMAMMVFVESYAGKRPPHDPLRMLYVQLHAELSESLYELCNQQPQCIDILNHDLASPTLIANIQDAFGAYKDDPAQFNAFIFSAPSYTLTGYLPFSYNRTLLDLAAPIIGADNYALNYDYSKWSDDASTPADRQAYGHKALVAAEAFAFPDKAARRFALGQIYTTMSRLMPTWQEADPLAKKAAIADNTQPNTLYTLCEYAYHMDDYKEAIKQCTASMARQNTPGAFYFRGHSYAKLKETAKAEPDLLKAIYYMDSLKWRKQAITILAVLYGQSNQLDKQLKLYSDHPEMFDEHDREPAADSYNNRCYTYMLLGKIDDAMADCNASLRLRDTALTREKLAQLLAMKAKAAATTTMSPSVTP